MAVREKLKLDRRRRDQTVHSFLDWACRKLFRAGIASSRLDAEILIADGLGVSRTQLMTHPSRVLHRAEEAVLRSKIERRVLREPISHIIGYQEFWSLKFKVDEKVLTPRPETEILVEQCLQALAKISSPSPAVKILELGTGSGIIPVTLAQEIPQSYITAIEKSAAALTVARENATRHAVMNRIRFVCEDMTTADWRGPHHLIVSNPPYIPSQSLSKCMPEVRQYEPACALDGGGDGLDYHRFIVSRAWEQLRENGLLALEIGHTQAAAVTALLQDSSRYRNVQVCQDYSGYDRVVLARAANG